MGRIGWTGTWLCLGLVSACVTAPRVVFQALPGDEAWIGVGRVIVAPVRYQTSMSDELTKSYTGSLARELAKWHRGVGVDRPASTEWLLDLSRTVFEPDGLPAAERERLRKEFPGSAVAFLYVDAHDVTEETDHEYQQQRMADGSYQSRLVLKRYRTEMVSGRLKLAAADNGTDLLHLTYAKRVRKPMGGSDSSLSYSVGAAVGSAMARSSLMQTMLTALAVEVARTCRATRPAPLSLNSPPEFSDSIATK
ncbi:MAG: hypothetical protein HS115_01200 [Spirochaetales bacterium]|nr:hypothetical protein [Spirochaetales bacterium]